MNHESMEKNYFLKTKRTPPIIQANLSIWICSNLKLNRNLNNKLHLKIKSIYGHGKAPSVSSAEGPTHCTPLQQADVRFQPVICLLFLSASQYIVARTLIVTFVQTAAPMQVKEIFNNSNYTKNSNTSHNKQRYVCWQKWFPYLCLFTIMSQ